MARYKIDGLPGVLETAEPDSGATWNGWRIPQATPTEIGRYLYDRARSMSREEWVECLFDFAAEYLAQVSSDGTYVEPVPSDSVRYVDGFTWIPADAEPHDANLIRSIQAPLADRVMIWACLDCEWTGGGDLSRREAREEHDKVGA